MNPLVELNLALVLFLPWFLILGTLFWLYPRQPRGGARRAFDAVALLLALAAFLASVHWSYGSADPAYGRMWRQVLATAIGYGAYLAVMTIAFLVRARWLRGR
ncbi:hypothetical protein H0E84_03225 [Luteimonas sp. SJ-92]|uniref:Transmembrane protein n=1 Tax=Luteimonas salinisoli TaxID=2752307 RepID=A0A853J8E3_9GAMM|nr:hypothetical protein [Luteimonas salinisoli]NZA25383.1 hypothetical protein [Luteimonas salinisoli]